MSEDDDNDTAQSCLAALRDSHDGMGELRDSTETDFTEQLSNLKKNRF